MYQVHVRSCVVYGQECTRAGVGHQRGWLEDTRDSVGCHRDMTSQNNSGHSLGFDNNMAVRECSAVWGGM
jgi:hypothetical protein